MADGEHHLGLPSGGLHLEKVSRGFRKSRLFTPGLNPDAGGREPRTSTSRERPQLSDAGAGQHVGTTLGYENVLTELGVCLHLRNGGKIGTSAIMQ